MLDAAYLGTTLGLKSCSSPVVCQGIFVRNCTAQYADVFVYFLHFSRSQSVVTESSISVHHFLTLERAEFRMLLKTGQGHAISLSDQVRNML
jgi:hypothetical protein